jgi:hypothetical protein
MQVSFRLKRMGEGLEKQAREMTGYPARTYPAFNNQQAFPVVPVPFKKQKPALL